MDPAQFAAKWRNVELKERSAAQEHFIDLCHVLGHPTPAEADPTGDTFCFEKGATKHGGRDGFADVWKKDFFGWEYKGPHRDLTVAYDQLLLYRDALANPPLLVVSDLDRIIVHTNFTNTVSVAHEVTIATLGEPRCLEILRAVFFEPHKLRPGRTSDAITMEAAERFAGLAESMRGRGIAPAAVAHFLNRLVFCLFAEDVGLLPAQLFSQIVQKSKGDTERLRRLLGQLFAAMISGGDFGLETIRHFDGGLFADADVPTLIPDDVAHIAATARLDWRAVDPSIFGTLFERGLDPDKRSQLGAHYTSRADIETLVEPVVMEPLRREWSETREAAKALLARSGPKAKKAAVACVRDFLFRLGAVRILDPACGSGNFLYVTLQKMKELEKEVVIFAMDTGIGGFLPVVGPWQLFGIEVNPYAHDLAQTAVWIGFPQWTRANGLTLGEDPVLRPMAENFRCADAILDRSGPTEPLWPAADFIVGNPPFLGNKRMRDTLGTQYAESLWQLYGDRLPATSDLCAYFFEKARRHVESGKCRAAGLLATTAIRQVSSRRVLERIGETGRIFFAVSDREWTLDGAAIRVSLVGFGPKNHPGSSTLDGKTVDTIHADLTAGLDLTVKRALNANTERCFMGTTKVGPFDIEEAFALELLQKPNPHGRPNSDVVRPFRNGSDLVRTPSRRWIVDFGVATPQAAAALYEAPFAYVVRAVKPEREKNARMTRAQHWWLLGETLPAFRSAIREVGRYVATPRVAKHRVFLFLDTVVLPDSKVIAFAFDDAFHLGVLQSHVHAAWTVATCGWHGVGNDVTYNPSTCFETFPFPVADAPARDGVTRATEELISLRDNWLFPEEWTRDEVVEFRASEHGIWHRCLVPGSVDKLGIGTARYTRRVPRDASSADQLATRTLTALYNDSPTWLEAAHRQLDEAVARAYGWDPDVSDEDILGRLLELNQAANAESQKKAAV